MPDNSPEATIGLLYQAAIEPEHWPAALAAVARESGASFANLFLAGKDGETRPQSLLGGDYARESAEPYVQYYHKIDPRLQLAKRMPEGVLYACHHHFDEDFVTGDETYQDFLIPYDIRFTAACTLIDEGGAEVVLGVLRNARRGPFDDASLGRLRGLAPHIKRAAQISRRLAGAPAIREGLHSLLELMDRPVIFTDVDRRIIDLNRAAEQLLNQGDAICVVGGRITARQHGAAHDLEHLVTRTAGTHGEGSYDMGGGLAVRRGDGRKPLLITAVPLPAQAIWRLSGDRPAVALLITDPELREAPPMRRLAQMFGLTRAEARLTEGLAAGQSLDAFAAEHGLSKNTVKSQLRGVFAKTGATRQTELVRLLGRLPSLG